MTHPEATPQRRKVDQGRFPQLRAWWERWGDLLLGSGLLTVAVVVAVVSVLVYRVEKDISHQKTATAIAARASCLRTKQFAPRLIDFYEVNGVLTLRESAEYRQTIPKTCPSK